MEHGEDASILLAKQATVLTLVLAARGQALRTYQHHGTIYSICLRFLVLYLLHSIAISVLLARLPCSIDIPNV